MRAAGRVPPVTGVDWCTALLSYRGAARELVARVKYRSQRAALDWLATGMAALVGGRRVDVVTWAPANPRHMRTRGFDHGELLARRVATRLDAPIAGLLVRAKGDPLTGRSARQRRGGPPLSGRAVTGSVLVVDDVITTGATLRAAARSLRGAGATSVLAVAAAYTPVSRSALPPAPAEGVPCG